MVVNLRTSLRYGEDSVSSPEARSLEEGSAMELARKLVPSWINGFEDYSCTIHSAGVSFWSAMGYEFGYESYSELPAPQNGPYAFVGTDVRSDSVWFDRSSGEPVTIVEFERYSGIIDAPKLAHKAGNLLLAHHRWEQRAK